MESNFMSHFVSRYRADVEMAQTILRIKEIFT